MFEYKIRLYDSAGLLKYEVGDMLSLSYSKRVNEPGLGVFRLPGNHSAAGDLADKWQVEIWRRDREAEVDWTRDFVGLFREPDLEGTDPGIFTATCPGILSMLGWRIVAWYANTNNRSKFTSDKAETIMKTLVDYNATANASTANGRLRAGQITGVSVQADGANGNMVDWYCSYDNLLATLRDLAQVAGGDFDLVKTGPTVFEFRWYTGQLGTDRTATILFSTGRGNMANPRLGVRRLGEKTVAIVAGQGEGEERDVEIRTGTNYNVSTNNIETFKDARDVAKGDSAALQTRGDQELVEVEAVDESVFDVLQIPSSLYGRDYFLGDKVKAVSPFTGSTVVRKVKDVNIMFDAEEGEQVEVELANV